MAGIAASTVSTGSELYRLGKLDCAELACEMDVVAAAHLAVQDLV
jgi:hypothetical protein